MKKQKNIAWIGALMTVSQLLLTAFVVQWLFFQYKEKKDTLTKELYQQFTDSKQQVMDSMIVTTLINPMFREKNSFKVHMEVRDHSVPGKNLPAEEDVRKIVLTGDSNDFTGIPDSSVSTVHQAITLQHSPDSKNDLLLHGVKLIYKEISSLSNDSTKTGETFYYKTDTVLLKKLLEGHLDKSGLRFNTQWIAGDTTGKRKSTIYFESNLFPKSYGVEISQFHFYLVRKMTPQFLFALVLLLLTGVAFMVAYRSLKNQARLSEMRNDFISNISHELKTPVSTVKVAIEALQNFDMRQDQEVAGEYLEMASLEMNRLDLLISQVLNTSMLEDGKQVIHPERTNLDRLIEEVLSSMKLRFNHAEAVVKFEPGKEELFATVDKLHVQGVLMNLLDNSMKYGHEKPAIQISLEEAANKILLAVEDNGPGIPPGYLDKIFEKFFRVPTGNRHNVKGYGLGLSYAALVMKQHGGAITVKNIDGGGCRFTLIFQKS